MTELVRDPLNGTPGDDLSVSNAAWSRQPGITGALIIAPDGESACSTATSNTAAYYRSDVVPSTPDYFVSADVTMLDAMANASAVGVIGRASNAAITHYQARFLAGLTAGAGTWQLRRIVNNSASTLASVAGNYLVGTPINIKMGMAGNNVSLYLDNNPTPLLGPVAGSTITAADSPGLLGTNITGTRVRIDNFVADDGTAVAAGNTALLAWTEGADAASLATLVVNRAAAAWTESDEASVVASVVTDRAALSWAEQGDNTQLRGEVSEVVSSGVSAALSWAEAGDAAAIVLRAANRSALAYAEQGDAWAMAAHADQPPVARLSVRFDVLPRNFKLKTIHFSN